MAIWEFGITYPSGSCRLLSAGCQRRRALSLLTTDGTSSPN
jgi:hypothetical protein